MIPFPIRYDQIANLANNLATCLGAGVEIRKAVRTSSSALAQSTPEFREVWQRIDEGSTLSESLRPLEWRLPGFVVPIIRCGEQTGRLDDSLRFLAEHCRLMHRPHQAVRNVWLLPVTVYVGGKTLVLLLMLLFGHWSGFLASIGDWVAAVGSVAALVILFVATPLRVLLDAVRLALPVLGEVERELAVNRFLHVLAMLSGTGGMRVEQMVRQACQTVGNEWLRRDLLLVAKRVEQQSTLTEAFDKTATLNHSEKSELAAGELAGKFSETCSRIADRVGESAATKLSWITQVAVRFTMAAIVFPLVIALLPLLQLLVSVSRMSAICRICLQDVPGDKDYHARCLRDLFGTSKVPTLDVEISKLHLSALEMVGHTSLAGIQKKLAVNLVPGQAALRVVAAGGRYILKPQTDTYPCVPENEHVTTRLAQLVEIDVSPNGIVALKDGSLAYIAKRFDRLPDGRKQRQEDFCQLAEQSPKEKYTGSGELCVRLVRKYASEPLVEVLKLFRLLLFVWWSGNGDMHLKNFSLMASQDGIMRFTPAYDLVCTRLVIPKDTLALPVLGKKDNLQRGTWREFANYCRLPAKVVNRLLDKQTAILPEAQRLIDRCFLPNEQKASYQALIEERTARLD